MAKGNVLAPLAALCAALEAALARPERWRGTLNGRHEVQRQALRQQLEKATALLQDLERELERCIEAIIAGSGSTELRLDYGALNEVVSRLSEDIDVMRRHVAADDLAGWQEFMGIIGEGAETHAQRVMAEWKAGRCKREHAIAALDEEKNFVRYARQLSEYLRDTLR